MGKKLKLFLIIIVTIVGLIFLVLPQFSGERGLTSPTYKKSNQQVVVAPTPGPRPKTFKFEASTDLKKELESINPQVLDSDFE